MKVKRNLYNNVMDFFFRLLLKFWFKKVEGSEVFFIREYPKLSRIEQGWVADKSPHRNAFMIIEADNSTSWVPSNKIYTKPNGKRLELEFQNFYGLIAARPMILLENNKIIVTVLSDNPEDKNVNTINL